ncbi:MAG TPA: phytanoyl-CoA dioxygenase family protein [Caulobacteraceae bacterium]|nr:phytanoyl-CoA dioxygenase family protein [Caulobacteraceae bacterium]
MAYPTASPEQIAFFREHGWLVVKDAIPADALDELGGWCERIMDNKEKLANDWAWSAEEELKDRSWRIVQSSPSFVWKEIHGQPYRLWLRAFAEALLGIDLAFWYDQFLAKPPGKSVPTYWHQDEAYWGRNLFDKGITGWIPLQDVDAVNGCMHFIDGGHLEGVRPHHLVEGMQSDLITCEVDEGRMVVCPIRRGDVTFHHSKTPHMTTANTSGAWRKAVTNHFQAPGSGGEGDHYPWKVSVNQRTGERIIPPSRPLGED